MENVANLPCYIACSAAMLCMYSDSWAKRLWCQSEAANLGAMGDYRELNITNMLICPLAESESQRQSESESSSGITILTLGYTSSVKVPKSRDSQVGGGPEVKDALIKSINSFPGGEGVFRQWVELAVSPWRYTYET